MGAIKMGEVHNVVAEQDGWGQLENGSWIKLDFTVPHKREETIEISENLKVLENSETLESSVTDINVVEEEQPEVEVVVDTIISTTAVPNNLPLHKVKKKESLWDIAELWYGAGNGERYIEIKEFNNLKSDTLRAGMVLKIPNV
jgi:LysM repeat protein